MKFYIHIGTHKTGTTEIQNLLKTSSGLVKDNKRLIYIQPNEIFNAISKQQVSSDDLSAKLQNYISQYISKNSIEGEYEDIVVISYENFSGIALSGYKNSNAIAKTIFNAVKLINPDSVIIVYLRRQDQFIESLYTQYIHQGKSWFFNEFLSKFDSDSFNWEKLVTDYSEYFELKNIRIGFYDKSKLLEGDLIKDFSSKIDFELEQLDFSGKNNGYTREALEIARICNETFDPNEKKKLRALLQATNCKKPFEEYAFFKNLQERYNFLKSYEKSNANIRLTRDSSVFKVEATQESRFFNGLEQDDVIQVVMRSLIECKRRKK
jgi:hypothetical protein